MKLQINGFIIMSILKLTDAAGLMGKKTSILLFVGFLFGGFFFEAKPVQAQDYRLSANYSIQSVGFNYVSNRTYNGEVGAVSKGMLEVELERYLFHQFYVAGKAEYLLHNQQSFMIGGPVDFEQFNLGALVGLQFPKFGVYGGVKAGSVWDLKIRATDPRNGNVSWVQPEDPRSPLTASLTLGIKYYLLNFVRLQAEVTQTHNLPQNIIPQSSFTENPAFRSLDFSPLSFSVGVSISIPWNRRKSKKNDIKLPPLMRVSGVNFSPPLKDTFVTSEFGPRWNREHQGVDLDAGLRDNILAVEQGVVVKAGNGRGYGKMVRIKHANGFESVYAHMSRISVKEGDRVRKGDVVGRAGNTGTSSGVHLHFEIIKDGTHVNPLSYLRF
jgi:hypothetical protein